MRLPTVADFRSQISNMSKQLERVTKLQEQVTTGKSIQQGSENPSLAFKITSASDFMDRLKAYDLNIKKTTSRLQLVESQTKSASNLIGRARDLVMRARNGTMDNASRETTAIELKNILASMVDIANTVDSDGQYIFSGMNTSQPAYIKEDGHFVYKGSLNGTQIAVGENLDVLYNESGFRVFGDIKSGNGSFSVKADASGNTGSAVLDSAKVSDISSLVSDTYTLTFVNNSAGDLAYQITGIASGQVIPTPPDVAPDDAPAYVSGESINFNGISTSLTGAANVGDTFTISPSQRQNIFETLQDMIYTLSTPTSDSKTNADFNQQISEQFTSLIQAQEHITSFITEVGSRENIVDRQSEFTESRIFNQEFLITRLSDVDLPRTISDLTHGLTILELTQKSYSSIQETMNHLLTR